MQFSKIIVAAFAAVAAAAPATSPVEQRSLLSSNDLLGINGGVFNLNSFSYLTSINGLGFQQSLDPLFASLLGQGFDIGAFNGIFQANVLNVDVIAQIANLQLINNLQLQGIFAGRNLANLAIPRGLNFGFLDSVGGVDLSQFILQSSIPNINAIAAQNVFFGKE